MSFFIPLHELIKPYLDEWVTPIIHKKIDYLLYEEPSRIITLENIATGMDDKQQEFYTRHLYPAFYDNINKFAEFATTGENSIDKFFEDEQTLIDFVKYLNDYDLEMLQLISEIYYGANTYTKKYWYDNCKIYKRHSLDPLTPHDIVKDYMHKHMIKIFLEYSEEIFQQLLDPVK